MRIINLLPKSKQQELHYELIFQGLVRVFWVSCFTYLLVFAAQLGVKIYLEHEVSTVQLGIDDLQQQVKKQDNATIKSKVTAVNNVVTDYKTLMSSSPQWSNLLRAFAPLLPEGVRINNMQADPRTKVVIISGFSPTRELVDILYYNILRDTQNFTGIDYYFENIVKSTNDNFHFTFTYTDSLMKSK